VAEAVHMNRSRLNSAGRSEGLRAVLRNTSRAVIFFIGTGCQDWNSLFIGRFNEILYDFSQSGMNPARRVQCAMQLIKIYKAVS
jgi:hypothetical protein